MREKVLVTGGTGYIGSHTAVELLQEGFEVVLLDNLENSFPEVLNGIEKITGKRPAFEQAELRNPGQVSAFFDRNPDITSVIHFAAYKAVGESMEKPLEYYHNNLLSFIHLLMKMKRKGINNIVFSSSCTVYGQPWDLPVKESDKTQRPTSPYGNTKKISEEILEDAIAANKDLKCISLRYFNPIGAHPSALIGELPIGKPNNLIPYITQSVAGLREEVTVYGDDYPTPDGTCIRDYIHVVDIARAHVTALKRLSEKKNAASMEVFNLGTGTGLSVLEVIEAFEKATGKKVRYKIGARRKGDVSEVYADTALANRVLGWKAAETVENMMKSAWDWQVKIPEIFPDKKF